MDDVNAACVPAAVPGPFGVAIEGSIHAPNDKVSHLHRCDLEGERIVARLRAAFPNDKRADVALLEELLRHLAGHRGLEPRRLDPTPGTGRSGCKHQSARVCMR